MLERLGAILALSLPPSPLRRLPVVRVLPVRCEQATHALTSSPKLFISGDSSGGGTAASALLAQSSPKGLPHSLGAAYSGGVLFSPWLNLLCDTPSYVSQIYKLESVKIGEAHTAAQCTLGDGVLGSSGESGADGLQGGGVAKVAVGGDVAFTDYPFTLSAKFAENGELYAGDPSLTRDPIASPTHATPDVLRKMVSSVRVPSNAAQSAGS